MLVAAAFGDGSNANALLDGGRVGEALAPLPERGKQAGGEHRAGTGQVDEQTEVWERLAAFGNVGVEVSDAGR